MYLYCNRFEGNAVMVVNHLWVLSTASYVVVFYRHSYSVFVICAYLFFFFSSRRRHTRSDRDWSSDVCSSDLLFVDQLHNTVRNRQCRQTSYRHNSCRRESRINKQINLSDTDSKQPWNHQSSYVPDPRMRKGKPEIELHALLYEEWYLYQELQPPPYKHSNHYGRRRVLKMAADHHEGKQDGCQIQADWSRRGQAKDMKTVQYTHRQCGQCYEKQVRKYDAVQLDGLGLGDVFSGKQVDYGGGKSHSQDRGLRPNPRPGPKKAGRKF